MTLNRDEAGTTRRWRWSQVLWVAMFTPLCVGLAIGGVLAHWAFLIACLLWLGALGCVLRMESLQYRLKALKTPSARDQLARAGWLFLAITLILGSGLPVKLALG